MRFYVLPSVQSLTDLINYLSAVLHRHQEKREREEDLEEGAELEDDDIFDEVEYEGFSPAEHIISMYAAYSSELTALLAYPMIIFFVWWGEGIRLDIGGQYGMCANVSH
jgi:hypothetical protein